jgi:hypothetical protein
VKRMIWNTWLPWVGPRAETDKRPVISAFIRVIFGLSRAFVAGELPL